MVDKEIISEEKKYIVNLSGQGYFGRAIVELIIENRRTVSKFLRRLQERRLDVCLVILLHSEKVSFRPRLQFVPSSASRQVFL
jgi:hypothetical protein